MKVAHVMVVAAAAAAAVAVVVAVVSVAAVVVGEMLKSRGLEAQQQHHFLYSR